jgi:hypothetical protein
MITSELVIYIKKQISKNLPKELITSRLVQNGWLIDDINEAFLKAEEDLPKKEIQNEILLIQKDLNTEEKLKIVEPELRQSIDSYKKEEKRVDPYREIPETLDISQNNILETVKSPIVDNVLEKKEDLLNPIKEGTESSSNLNLTAASFSPVKKTFADFKNNVSSFNPIIPIKQNDIPVIQNTNEVRPNEPKTQEIKSEQPKIQEIKPEIPKEEITKPGTEESVPTWVLPKVNATSSPDSTDVQSGGLFKSAILSSYRNDVDSINNIKNNSLENIDNPKNKKSLKGLLVVLIILILGGGVAFAFIEGYISLPFSFIKKDPKLVIADFTNDLKNLDSYKTDSEINLSSPLLADISSGLYNGEAINSKERDNVSIVFDGVTKNKDIILPISKYNIIFSSSLLKEKIKFNVIYNGYNIFAKIPDLSTLLGSGFSVEENTVSIPKEKLSVLNTELPSKIKESFINFDIFGILSKFISNGEEDRISVPLKTLITNSSVVDKGQEFIKGNNSYHYEIVVDRDNTKSFVLALINNFGESINPEQKEILKNNAGFLYIDSFEIWVSKKNNILSQYKVVLSVPLSKILQLDDKGVGDNKITLEFRSSFYDFNNKEEISTPKIFIQVDDYLKLLKDTKISSIFDSFVLNSQKLKNDEGFFGKVSNKGSCVSPSLSSLFSPLGHNINSSSTVGAIAENMNKLLAITNNSGVCNSTLSDWVLAVPLNRNNLILCIDSSGNRKTLENYPEGNVCEVKEVSPIVEGESLLNTTIKNASGTEVKTNYVNKSTSTIPKAIN